MIERIVNLQFCTSRRWLIFTFAAPVWRVQLEAAAARVPIPTSPM